MALTDLLFYVFSAIMLLSGVAVISCRNAVHSVMFLILAFFNAAGLFVLMGAEYVAMLLVIVYVGAVAVLFLFVVMMLDVATQRQADPRRRHVWVGGLVGMVLLGELAFVFSKWSLAENARDNVLLPGHADTVGTATALGNVLYTHYLYPFQVSGLILLVAMIGAITLCLRLRSGIRRQKAHTQVTRTPDESMHIVHVETGKGVKL